MKNYIKEVNYIRGLAIFLVFIGHAATPSFLARPIYYEIVVQFIYGFHMPVFFIVAGFLAINIDNISSIKGYFSYVKERFLRLGIPFIILSIITNLIIIALSYIINKQIAFSYILDSAKVVLLYPELGIMGALWFLYTLFIINIISPLLYKVKMIIIIPILILLNLLVPKDLSFLAINRVGFFLIFYFIGIYCRKLYEEGKIKRIKINKFAALVSFILIGVYAVILTKGIVSNKLVMDTYLFICGILGSLLVLYLISVADRNKFITKTLNIFGKFSMDIYIFSWFFQIASMIFITKIMNISNYNIFFISNILVGSLCLPFSIYIIRRIPILAFLFVGSKIKKKEIEGGISI